MKDHFLLLGAMLAVLLVMLQAVASLNASREINLTAAESMSVNSTRQSN